MIMKICSKSNYRIHAWKCLKDKTNSQDRDKMQYKIEDPTWELMYNWIY